VPSVRSREREKRRATARLDDPSLLKFFTVLLFLRGYAAPYEMAAQISAILNFLIFNMVTLCQTVDT
jgi:hypothetical protein